MIDPHHHPASGPDLDPAAVDDLRLRLRGAKEGERAARREARRLARELALARRLLKFYLGTPPPPCPPTAKSVTALLTEAVVYHFDVLENFGAHTAVSGWAFRPASGWDARRATIKLLLRHGDTVYMTTCRAVQRPDVAAFYAGQPPETSGGVVGLEGAGFACEIGHQALPNDTEWKIVLRLECDGQACEQFTGQLVRI